jgi:hypothetical protein
MNFNTKNVFLILLFLLGIALLFFIVKYFMSNLKKNKVNAEYFQQVYPVDYVHTKICPNVSLDQTDIGVDCYNQIWSFYCSQPPQPYSDWHKNKTKRELIQDSITWATTFDNAHRIGCYGKYTSNPTIVNPVNSNNPTGLITGKEQADRYNNLNNQDYWDTKRKAEGRKLDFSTLDKKYASEYTAIWLKAFIHDNPGAQKIKDRLIIKDQLLYITQNTESYQVASNIVKSLNSEPLLIGYTDDNHVGQIRMKDNKWLSIDNVFELIAGPGIEKFRYYLHTNKQDYIHLVDQLEQQCKHMTPLQRKAYLDNYIEYFNIIDDAVGLAKDIGNKIGDTAKDIGNKIKDGAMTAADWVKARANDVAAFTKAAAENVGSWAKNMANDALDWAKGAGKFIVENLIDIGNKIGKFAREAATVIAETAVNTVNSIKDFFGNLYQKAKDAFNSAINWIKNNLTNLWDKIKDTVGTVLNIILQGAPCEYTLARDVSKLHAVQALEPTITPQLREIALRLIKSTIEAASGGLLLPFIEIIIPIIQKFSDFNEKVDGLLNQALEQNIVLDSITTIADNTIMPIVDSACSLFKPPNDIDDINIDETKANTLDDNQIKV